MAKFRILVKTPLPGSAGGLVNRYAIIEADSYWSAFQLAKGQYGEKNVLWGGPLKTNDEPSKDIASQLKTLNDLYKSGAITKIEFEKSKTKLLK